MDCFLRQYSAFYASTVSKDVQTLSPVNHLLVNVSLSTALWTSCWTSEAPVPDFVIAAVGVATIPKPRIQMEIFLLPFCYPPSHTFSKCQVADLSLLCTCSDNIFFFLNLQIDCWTVVTEVWILWKDVLLPPSSKSQVNLASLLQLRKLYNSLWGTCTLWINASHMISFVPAFV